MVMNIEQEHQTHAQTHAGSEAHGKPSCQRTEEILFRITAKKGSFEQREKKNRANLLLFSPLCLHIFPLIIAEAPEFNAKIFFS
jgi:hypothetical protein